MPTVGRLWLLIWKPYIHSWMMKDKEMNSTVGQSLGISRVRTRYTTAFAIAMITADFVLVLCRVRNMYAWRVVLAISAMICLFLLAHRNLATIGVVFRPRQGFRYWTKVTIVLGAVLVVLLSLVLVACWVADVSLPYEHAPRCHPRPMLDLFLEYPLLEETLYRLVLLTPLLALIGSRWTIFIGGAIFAALHFAYGNPGPDNFVAGYLLAWACIKSRSILVPVALHSLGNGCCFAFQVSYWYLIT